MTKQDWHAELLPGERLGQVRTVRHSARPRPARVFLAGHPCVYEVRAGRTADGPVLLDLRVTPLEDGQPITAALLKSIPVRRLAAAAIHNGAFDPADDHAPEPVPVELDWSRWREPERPEPRGPGGRPRMRGPEHFAEVAEVARDARSAGESARRRIAEKWTVSEATAEKWMFRARRLGMLEHHQRGPNGEAAR